MIFPFVAVQVLMMFYDRLSITFVVFSFFTILFYILWKIWASWGFMGAGRFEKPAKSSVFIIFSALSITATGFFYDGYLINENNIVYNKVTQEVVYVGDSESSSYYVFADNENLISYNFYYDDNFILTTKGVSYEVSYNVLVDKQFILTQLDSYAEIEDDMLQLLTADISQKFDTYTTLDDDHTKTIATVLRKPNALLDDLNEIIQETISKSAAVKACELIKAAGYITETGECAMQITDFSVTKSED